MAQYRITIGSRIPGPGLPSGPPGKLEGLKAVIVGILALACIIGVLLAAFVLGSIIASVLLLAVAIALIVWLARRLLMKLKPRR